MKIRNSAYFVWYKTKLAIHILYNTQYGGRDVETFVICIIF